MINKGKRQKDRIRISGKKNLNLNLHLYLLLSLTGASSSHSYLLPLKGVMMHLIIQEMGGDLGLHVELQLFHLSWLDR